MKDRRKDACATTKRLRADLNESQLHTLNSLETFGWELKFIRRPLFQDPVPVVFDGDRQRIAILEADGTLNEDPLIDVRN